MSEQKLKLSIGQKNAKMGFIPYINLPALVTCRPDAPCKKGCYALKGNYTFNNVKKGILKNYLAYLQDKEDYFKTIQNFVDNDIMTYKYFRYHATGDIISYDYLLKMIETANKCKKTSFLCFTKKYELVNIYLTLGHKIPRNLTIVFSAWDKDFKFDNPFNLPVAYVNFKDKKKNMDIPKTAKKCKGDCSTCKLCWKLKEGEAVEFGQH